MSLRTDVLTWLNLNFVPANCAFTFEEGSGTPTDKVTGTKQPTVNGTPSWQTDGTYGSYYRFDATGDNLQMLTTSGGANNFGHFLSTTQQTIILVRKKTDTTLRAHFTFSPNTASNGGRCSTHLPYSDGIIYWDFGGVAAPNRISWNGYTPSTNVELWIVKAGTQGSKIFKDGTQVASQGTAITHVNDEGSVQINAGFLVNGDLTGVFFIAFCPYEIPDALITQLSVTNFSTTSILGSYTFVEYEYPFQYSYKEDIEAPDPDSYEYYFEPAPNIQSAVVVSPQDSTTKYDFPTGEQLDTEFPDPDAYEYSFEPWKDTPVASAGDQTGALIGAMSGNTFLG